LFFIFIEIKYSFFLINIISTDFEAAVVLDPSNKQAKTELNKVIAILKPKVNYYLCYIDNIKY